MQVYALNHQGVVRTDNDDRLLSKELATDTILLAVADGMEQSPIQSSPSSSAGRLTLKQKRRG